MSQIETAKIEIDLDDIVELLIGMEELCEGLKTGACSLTAMGVLVQNKELDEGLNAREFIATHYTALQGAITMIGAAASIINTALVNDDIRLVQGE